MKPPTRTMHHNSTINPAPACGCAAVRSCTRPLPGRLTAAVAAITLAASALLSPSAKAVEPGPTAPLLERLDVNTEATLVAALTAIGTAQGHIRVLTNPTAGTSGLIKFTAKRTIPANVTLEVTTDAGFDFDNTADRLVIFGPLVTAHRKIFFDYSVPGSPARQPPPLP